MSFHEELNQKLNIFFNRDWSVELSEQEEEKMEELAAGLVKDFGWDTVCNEFRASVLGILVVESPD